MMRKREREDQEGSKKTVNKGVVALLCLAKTK